MKTRLFIIAALATLLVACDKHEFRTEQIKYSNTTLLPNSSSDSLMMDIEIEYPVDMANQDVLLLIQRDLIKTLLDNEITDGQLGKEAVIQYAHGFEQGYISAFDADEYDTEGLYCWENVITGRVMSVTENILAYCDERYVYFGGPHGINSRRFYNYDLNTGKYLTEDDLFTEGYLPILTQLLIDNLVGQYEEFESENDIRRSDFRLEDIRPNGNFYFTDYEMVYVFNPYEIAPYYIGETEISIDLNDVRNILRKDIHIIPANDKK